MNFAQLSRTVFLMSLIVCACFAAARAQAVYPSVCITPNSRSGSTTLTANAAAGEAAIYLDRQNGTVPLDFRIVINPGTTEERLAWAQNTGGNRYALRTGNLAHPHNAGETVLWFTDVTATWGYHNTGSSTRNIPRGITSFNFFTPGSTSYAGSGQPNQFLPGIHTAFSMDFPTRDGISISWVLDAGQVPLSAASPVCATITYQGRLTEAGAAANGIFDLQFTAFDQLTGGAAQGDNIVVEDASVANGVFTVQLNFYSALHNNPNARFLEIGVRAGTATGAFTILAPRQPLTSVPFAVNATNVSGGTVRLPLTPPFSAPPASECASASQYGQTRVDAQGNRLYICTATGWKSTALQ